MNHWSSDLPSRLGVNFDMRTLKIAMAVLTAGFLGCKKSPPAVPPTGFGQAGTPAAAPAAPAGPDRAAAKAANTAGMKLYKEKNYAGAAEKFRAAISADTGFVLAHYNLACVAALTSDKETARAQLEFLAQSDDPYAHAKLAKAAGDADLKELVRDEKIGPILRWGEAFLGYRPLATASSATEAEAARLSKEGTVDNECDADAAKVARSLKAELFADSPGPETLILSMNEGMVVLDGAGKVLAKGPTLTCEGSQSGISDVSIGQVIADAEPEIVIHYTSGGRAEYSEQVAVFKRKGKELANILDVAITENSRTWKANEESWDEFASSGKLSLSPDGVIRYRSEDGKSSEAKKWDATKFDFVAAPVIKKPAPAGPVVEAGAVPLHKDWELRDEKTGPCGCTYAVPKWLGTVKFAAKGDKTIGTRKEKKEVFTFTAEPATTTPEKYLASKMETFHSQADPATVENGWNCQASGGEDGEWWGLVCVQLRDHPDGGKQLISLQVNYGEGHYEAKDLAAAGALFTGVNAKKGK